MKFTGIINKIVKKKLVKREESRQRRRRSKSANVKMGTRSRSIVKTAISITHRLLTVLVRTFLTFIYGEKGNSMPPIKNLILLDSATTLGYKIRTRKVCSYFFVYKCKENEIKIFIFPFGVQLTSVAVVKAFIQRIQEVNPLLNCVVDERFADALKEAEKADALIASGTLSEEDLARDKPYLGVPITTKDCIQVKGLLNTAGIYYRKDVRAEEDAPVIDLMRKAGAIPLALTNVSECCMW